MLSFGVVVLSNFSTKYFTITTSVIACSSVILSSYSDSGRISHQWLHCFHICQVSEKTRFTNSLRAKQFCFCLLIQKLYLVSRILGLNFTLNFVGLSIFLQLTTAIESTF